MVLVDVNINNQIIKKDATIKSNIRWSDSMNKKQMSYTISMILFISNTNRVSAYKNK